MAAMIAKLIPSVNSGKTNGGGLGLDALVAPMLDNILRAVVPAVCLAILVAGVLAGMIGGAIVCVFA